MDWYFVGVDFGQSRDYSAIAVMERAETKGEFDRTVWACEKKTALRLRYLERVPLGTPYPEVVDRVVRVTNDAKLAGRCHLAVDGTGVGRPVVDLLRAARPKAALMPVTFTGGQVESYEQGFYRVPKRDLIVGLQVLLQRRGLQIAAGPPFARTLAAEMEAMEVKISAAGNEQYAAWREGTHDDLVFSVALAYWAARKTFPPEREARDRWWTNEDRGEAARMFERWYAEEERKAGMSGGWGGCARRLHAIP